jgi:hypothetical protein
VIIVAASVLGVILLLSPDNMLAFVTALMAAATVIVASPITVGLIVDARHHRRSAGQLPQRPPAAHTGDPSPATDPPGTAPPVPGAGRIAPSTFLPSHQDYPLHITELKGARQNGRNSRTR